MQTPADIAALLPSWYTADYSTDAQDTAREENVERMMNEWYAAVVETHEDPEAMPMQAFVSLRTLAASAVVYDTIANMHQAEEEDTELDRDGDEFAAQQYELEWQCERLAFHIRAKLASRAAHAARNN